jgi:hypothetical protein
MFKLIAMDKDHLHPFLQLNMDRLSHGAVS